MAALVFKFRADMTATVICNIPEHIVKLTSVPSVMSMPCASEDAADVCQVT